MLKKILIASATVVTFVLVIGLALPSKYRVERSTTVRASSEAVYAAVADLRRWQDWVPWNAKTHPGTQWTFGGPELGVGAVRSWSGEDVGQGTLSLTQAEPKTGVAYDMSVGQGRYLLHGRISFAPVEQGTRVTWVDEGDVGGNPFAHYLVPLIRSRLGGGIEEALAGLQRWVEAHPREAVASPEPAPAPVEQAPAPPQPPASEHPVPPQVAEGSQTAPPPGQGSEVAAPPPAVEGSTPSTPGEGVPPVVTAPPAGEQAPASGGTTAPSGEPVFVPPVPSGASTTIPASTPAPAPTGASSTPISM
ncbi:SRPBCC family protein [Vitiosangium sp. GDMCC 1.1324]|uniref:SRPBCC family protein n=1 Tax=Vitiosangium sp. (strain GDMCC 1.1324) TaxID=2138576 RepID=UPI00130E5B83|nr:SRPBCC family protein [Vitiosangium sp. GDMCC 1.1324]